VSVVETVTDVMNVPVVAEASVRENKATSCEFVAVGLIHTPSRVTTTGDTTVKSLPRRKSPFWFAIVVVVVNNSNAATW